MPALSGDRFARVERELAEVGGVRRVRASPRTHNVLVEYDGSRLDEGRVVRRLRRLAVRAASAPAEAPPARPSEPGRGSVIVTHSSARRARIAVRGLDRDPELRRVLTERLEQLPGVRRAVPSALTGRVLVELKEGTQSLQGILDEIGNVEPPDGTEELPAHPLDPAPIIDASAKLIGATVGLGLLVVRRARGAEGAPVSRTGPGEVAGALSLVEGVPAISHRIEEALGRQRKAFLFGAIGIVSMSAAGSALGLAFTGAGAARLLTERLARRKAWREYLERLGERPAANPGTILSLSPGQRAPLGGTVVEGFGVAAALDASPQPLFPGATIDAGARVHGGSVKVRLGAEPPVEQQTPRPPPPPPLAARYLSAVPYAALAYSAATLVVTRSPARALTGLLLVNPAGAVAAIEAADLGASARVLRAGGTVAGSRPGRVFTRPGVLLVDGARTLTDGWELREATAIGEGFNEEQVRALAGAVSVAVGSPWGVRMHSAARVVGVDGAFDGRAGSAEVGGERWVLAPPDERMDLAVHSQPGDHLLVLRRQRDGFVAGVLALQPHLTRGVAALTEACRSHDVALELVSTTDSPTVRRIADSVGATLVVGVARERVSELQSEGQIVAVVADSSHAAPAFEQCDLAIGITSGLSGSFEARADVLAPRLEVVVAIVEAGARRDAAVRDSTLMSIAANVGGAVWGVLRSPPFKVGARPAQIAGLAGMADGTARLWGGRRHRTVTERLMDPLPERWGLESIDDVLRQLETTTHGLTVEEAAARWRPPPEVRDESHLVRLVLQQVNSPIVAVLGAGAVLSLALGALGDVTMIVAVVAANALVGAWEEGRASRASEALHELSAGTARVMRSRREVTVTPAELVAGDVVLLAPGDRIPADARLIETEAFEVDEAALTGESMPVVKSPHSGSASGRVVLEGTDVTIGSGRAVVVAVGRDTRMGAIAAALAAETDRQSPLDERLSRMLRDGLPWIVGGGLAVTVAGVLWGRPPLQQLALGASVAIAAVPEGLPLLAGTAEAAVARRLAERNALVTRLSAVEALGRVDVACVDKTGTLTTGTPVVTLVADPFADQAPPERLPPPLKDVLRAAAMASPSPDAIDAHAHPTDVAVLAAAAAAGVVNGPAKRQAETRFDPVRAFHATLADGHVWVKGAAETLAERCTFVRAADGNVKKLTAAGRRRLLERAAELAASGLRVLLVAEGDGNGSVAEPANLTALGFVAISDPLRPTAREAVRRCTEAGVRLIMLTGDHPATAKAIARDAGLPVDDGRVLMGADVALLDDETLLARIERATVIARTTPLDKLRIVEVLRQGGHVVAMTGDGVNDAPALRLADVGVAMGRAGTEVARQAADLVLADDDFSTLAEALVEGRGFWLNMRRALGLLLGGNGGEVGLMTAAAIVGFDSPLTTRQVLAVNLVTDVLPAISVAIQPPEHRNLSELSREGSGAMEAALRADIIRRSIATGASSFLAYLIAARTISPEAGRNTAYLSIVGTQLAQTLDIGRAEGRLTPSVAGAIGASVAVMAATVAVPGLRRFLGVAPPTPGGLALTGGASALAVVLGRTVPAERWVGRA
jgi:calcium-translocating P-type ATPase